MEGTKYVVPGRCIKYVEPPFICERLLTDRSSCKDFHDDLSPSHNISAEAINQIGVISIHCHRFQHCNWDDPDEDDDILDVAPKLKNNAPAKALIRSGADMSTRYISPFRSTQKAL